MVEHRQLYFRAADLDYPVIEKAARDRNGEKLKLKDSLPEGEPSEVILTWGFSSEPPDLLNTLSQHLYISERARRTWGLENGPAYELVPVRLTDRSGKKFLDATYWWVKIRTRVAILDEEKSQGKKMGPIYHEIDRFAVNWANVPDIDIFLCDMTVSAVFSERLVAVAKEAGLTGALFREVDGGRWPPRSLQ
ncbi:MAG TPA: hypothetical protein VEK57_23450 [Thermoanaerobaculia bacterium]|nr:hypothetical protein [Thermoanaerobaculia bacterium]